MKRLSLFLLALGILGAARADSGVSAADVQLSTRPLQAVFVWALGKDVQNVADVELDIQEELIKHGVAGERSSKLFPKGMSGPSERLLSRIRATGCDSVLVTRRTSSIQWQAKDALTASLHAFILHRAELLNPKDALQGNFNAPIEVANVANNANWEIAKGEAIVFDLKSGLPLWRGNTQIKSAKDLPQAKYLQFVAEKVVHELETAGLIGPVKK